MYRRILVALDRSDARKHMMEEAIALAKATGGVLHLVHVLSFEDEHAPGLKEKGSVEFQRRLNVFEQDGEKLIQSALVEATDAGIPTVHSLMPGQPGRIICDIAANWQADLILIGRRRITGIQEFILGSVSNYVVHSAPCSVFIVQGDAAGDLAVA